MKKHIHIILLSVVLLGLSSTQAIAEPAKTKVSSSQMQSNKINLNTASLEQLVTLPGVGKKKAAAIIDYRKKNGNFKSIDDLANVKGVGKKMINKFRNLLTLG
ncbi:ComEA family DNA-binding protein [Paraglaciecola sp. L3A3]|uniref:ComEA family DNA-binding protein n=1 Tax=Paraglaciecola sp. L3A3 TaxID=2686358 RepID=UPI00131A6FC4|nr:ComEA family DNA-binding protein [Paraglaciecola sp. L3A3]